MNFKDEVSLFVFDRIIESYDVLNNDAFGRVSSAEASNVVL